MHKPYVEGEVIVKYKEHRIDLDTAIGSKAHSKFASQRSLEKKRELKDHNAALLRIKDKKSVEQKIRELVSNPEVDYAEPNYLRYPTAIPANDALRETLWGLDNTGQTIGNSIGTPDADIDAPEAWTINEGTNASIIVAVIDTGVAYNHPDLLPNMWDGTNCKDENGNPLGGCKHGYDFANDDKDPLPIDDTHGTHVAGTIAAVKNNAKGIIGVAPNAKIMALPFGFDTASEVRAMDFALHNGAKVINASYGGGGFSQLEVDAQNRFRAAGGLFVAAAGNSNRDNDLITNYPSGYDHDSIIAVAATDNTDARAVFSNYGSTTVDVGAPGVNINSTVMDGSGTTIASENFDSLTPPALPSGWTIGGGNNKWATILASSTVALTPQAIASPYDANASSTITSSVIDLSGTDGASISLESTCDVQYSTFLYYDYLALEASDDGTTYSERARWDEYDLDRLNGDSDPTGAASATVSVALPSFYATNAFRFRLRWITSDSDNNYLGCTVDSIVLSSALADGSAEQYTYLSGTSMASPHVAGLVALIWGYKPSLTAAQVKNIVLTTGDSIPALSGKTVSGKRINAHKALMAVNPSKQITAFTIQNPQSTGVIDEQNRTIALSVPSGTDVTALVPTITMSGASVSPASGTPQNFANPVTYTVTAGDGSAVPYTVTVTVLQPSAFSISGAVSYYDTPKKIQGATVSLLNASGAEIATTTTDIAGTYAFASVPANASYAVRVQKSDASANGLSSADQIKIGLHIVGLEILDSIFKLIAGDVNWSGALSSADQIKIGRFIVGLDATLPSDTWKFYPSDASLTADNYRTATADRTISNLTSAQSGQDFIGIKMGDANNSWTN